MERFEKLATPATAATVGVPERGPPPGLVPMATVMLAVELVTVLPFFLMMGRRPAGALVPSATVLVAWTVKASLEAAAGLMLKPPLVAPVSGAEAAVRV